jgi:hypothetical protein
VNNHLQASRIRQVARATVVPLILIFVFSVVPASGVAAGQSGPPPTAGEIVVDSYNCGTGALSFRVSVTDLPHVTDPDLYDEPLTNGFLARYEQGPNVSPSPNVYNPPVQDAPYTGDVSLTNTVPPSNFRADRSDPFGPVVSIEIIVKVGYLTAVDNPTDISRATFVPDCAGDGLVDGLIAALKRILQQILAG